MITHTIGAVLAGGQSHRMGREKASLIIEGTPFLERTHAMLSDMFTEVIVCGGSMIPSDGVLIPDERSGEGPLSGLLSALRIARGRNAFVVPIDVPLINPEIIRTIVEPPVPADGVRIAVANDRVHPLIGVYGSGVAPIVRERFEAGHRSVFSVLDEVKRVVQVEVPEDAVFNVNTEADYEKLIERYGL